MGFVTVQGNTVRLPPDVAAKLRGRRLVVEERRTGVFLSFGDDQISAARGMLKGKGLTSDTYMAWKREDVAAED